MSSLDTPLEWISKWSKRNREYRVSWKFVGGFYDFHVIHKQSNESPTYSFRNKLTCYEDVEQLLNKMKGE